MVVEVNKIKDKKLLFIYIAERLLRDFSIHRGVPRPLMITKNLVILITDYDSRHKENRSSILLNKLHDMPIIRNTPKKSLLFNLPFYPKLYLKLVELRINTAYPFTRPRYANASLTKGL